MARLQILQLPEGAGDDRPPYLLVIDQVPSDEAKFDAIRRDLLGDGDLAPRLGARAVLCFEETIDIPANEPLPLPLLSVQGDSQTAELIHAHEQTRLALCGAFLLSLDSTWAQIVETAMQRQRNLAGLLRERDVPDPKLVTVVRETLGIETAFGGAPFDEILFKACRELQKSEAAREHLRAERAEFAGALARVRNLPAKPELMSAEQPHPDVWLHGYQSGVLAARAATRLRNEPTVKP